MYNPTEQFAEFNKSALDFVNRFSQLARENTESLIKVQLEASKAALEDGAKNAKAASEIKDVQEFVAIRTKLAETETAKALSYSRSVYEVATKAQSDFSKLVEEAIAAYTKGLASFADRAAQNAPAGSEAIVTAFKSGLAATTAAIGTMTKAAKEVASFADAQVKAGAQATATAVNATGRKAA
jgi:phasin family protein